MIEVVSQECIDNVNQAMLVALLFNWKYFGTCYVIEDGKIVEIQKINKIIKRSFVNGQN